MRRAMPLLLAASLLAACGGKSQTKATTGVPAPPPPAPTTTAPPTQASGGLFGYDRAAPLQFQDKGAVNPEYPIRVHDISFASPKGGRVLGYLVLPPVKGRKPAVIYMHGSGGNRTQFLAPASWIAARGAVALTLDSPEVGNTTPFAPGVEGLHQQRDLTVQAIVELRRAIDLLQARGDVDPKRIAFVGWSYGARIGALLAGVDHRIASFDLYSGGALPPDEYARVAPKDIRKAVRSILSTIDPLRYVAKAAPSALFFQDGTKDKVVPHKALVDLFTASSKPKSVRWYKTGHEPTPQSYRDGLAWLSGRLGLGGVVVRGVRSGP
jgi:dienelactone hydrolase